MRDHVVVIGDVLLLFSAVAMLAFAALYHRRAQWEQTSAGRHLMMFSVVFSLVLLFGAGTVVLGHEYAGKPFVRTVVYAALLWATLDRIALLIRVQRPRGKTDDREPERDRTRR